jgi:hypothetical protein
LLTTAKSLRENKPDTSASRARAMVNEQSGAMVTIMFFLALDAAEKPYYCGSKNPHVSALFTTALLGLAPVRSTRATAAQPPEKHERLSV